MADAPKTDETVDKASYKAQLPDLRVGLLNAQFDLRNADFPVVVLIMGDDRLALDDATDTLHEWMDARYLQTEVFYQPTDEEQQRPRFWRYWKALPRHGECGVFLGAWALGAVAERIRGELKRKAFERRLDVINRFEADLVDDGALILKFWFHLPEKELRRRLKKAKKNPDKGWWVEDVDWQICEQFDEVVAASTPFLHGTDTAAAPWHVIDSTDRRTRNLTLGKIICEKMTERLASAPAAADVIPAAAREDLSGALAAVDLTATLDDDEYEERLEAAQTRVHDLATQAREAGLSTILAFEGWDAAGKGGAIRRITRPVAARDYRVIPIAAPTEEEKAHHYLWRFWRRLPRAGRMAIFDRSWYGRVLVERVEGFAREDEWRRAYGEINDFESQMVDHGWLVQKFWLHIDPDEQLRRFEARAETPFKKYKLTDEDLRNREKWDAYVAAVDEMVARTSTADARWHLVPANDKKWARVQVIETVIAGMERALS